MCGQVRWHAIDSSMNFCICRWVVLQESRFLKSAVNLLFHASSNVLVVAEAVNSPPSDKQIAFLFSLKKTSDASEIFIYVQLLV